jgi:3-oxoacyl-[acyl-carrier-protein] synthase-3
MTALLTASSLIHSEIYRRVLIVSAETGTAFRNMKEPESAVLFGDGAAAVVVTPTPEQEESGVLDWEMTTWPEGAELTEFRGGGTRHPPDRPDKTKPEDNLFSMQGPEAYRLGRRQVARALQRLFKRNGITPGDVDWVIPHQASGPAVEAAGRYGFDARKVINIVSEYGNCIAASIPMALVTAHNKGLLERGDLLLLGGTGAGLSVAFALLRW